MLKTNFKEKNIESVSLLIPGGGVLFTIFTKTQIYNPPVYAYSNKQPLLYNP